MYIKFDFITAQVILSFLLTLARTSSLFLVTPLFGKKEVPSTIKIGSSAVIALAMYQHVVETSQNLIITDIFHLSIAIFHEVIIGLIIGFTLRLVFDGVITSSQLLGTQVGLSSSNVFNPALGASVNPTAQLFDIANLMIFIIAGGFYNILNLLKISFDLIPLASYNINFGVLAENYIGIFGEIFSFTFKLVLPLIALMFIVDILVAVIAKILPQANMYFLVMPNKIFLGAFAIIMILPAYSENLILFFNETLYDLVDRIFGV